MKTIGFCTVFIAGINSACTKYPDKSIFIEFADKARFPPILPKAISLTL